jgi:hypothetical protein
LKRIGQAGSKSFFDFFDEGENSGIESQALLKTSESKKTAEKKKNEFDR